MASDLEDGDSEIPSRIFNISKPTNEEIEFRKKCYPDVSTVIEENLRCTICLKELVHVILLKNKAYKHIFLDVLICKSCKNFYGNGDFSMDEDGDEKYCRWCGQGGILYLCEKCPTAFCKKCIRRNFDKKVIASVEKDDWRCFFCDPRPLFKLRAQVWAIEEHLANLKKKEEERQHRKSLKMNNCPKKAIQAKKTPCFEGSDVDLTDHIDFVKTLLRSTFDRMDSALREPLTKLNELQTKINTFSTTSDLKAMTDKFNEILNLCRTELSLAEDDFANKLVSLSVKISEGKTDGSISNPPVDDSNSNLCVNPKAQKKLLLSTSNVNLTNGASSSSINVDSSIDMFESSIAEKDADISTAKAEPPPVEDHSTPIADKSRPLLRLKPLSELLDPTKTSKSPKPSTANSQEPGVAKLRINSNCQGKKEETKSTSKKETLKKSLSSLEESSSKQTCSQKSPPGKKKFISTEDSSTDSTGKAKYSEQSSKAGEGKHKSLSPSRPSDSPLTNRLKSSESNLPDVVEIKSRNREIEDNEKSVAENDQSDKDSDKPNQSSDTTTSSSDPLSDKSEELKKKKKSSQRKVNRSYFTDSDSEEENDVFKKKKEKSLSKARKKILQNTDDEDDSLRKKSVNTYFSDSDDDVEMVSSDTDLSEILGKNKKNSTKRDGKKKGKQEKLADESKTKSKKASGKNKDSDSDYDIRNLLNLETLHSKRGRSPKSSGSSSGDDVDTGGKLEKQSKKKSKNEAEKLDDFYDPDDNEERDIVDTEEDYRDSFRKELSLRSEVNIDGDLRASILKLSSTEDDEIEDSEEESSGVPLTCPQSGCFIDFLLKIGERDSEGGEPVKSKEKKADPSSKKKKVGPAKRYYKDKLLTMKLDSDSEEDMKKLDEKYQKKRLAEKEKNNENKSSDSEDEAPAVKPKQKRKAIPMKKFFSDSDSLGTDSDTKSKNSSKGSKANSDDNSDKDKKSQSSDSESSEKNKTPAKKRRRIRRQSDSSSASEGDHDKSVGDSATKRRKNIRKVLKEDDLKQTTQAALKSEQERKKRIIEKQKLYNSIVDTEMAKDKELTELVLDFDPETKEKILVVNADLVKKLKPHQGEGVKFMWDCCFETVEMAKKKDGSGCILAHCMGLGKSLQVVTLVHTVITNPEIGVRTALIVAPLSTVLNWVNEFNKWLKDVGSGDDVEVFHMNKTLTSHRASVLKEWHRVGGVLILGYNLLRSLTNPKGRIKPSFKKIFQETLVEPGPDIVICDEGHILKNEKTAISTCMSKLKTKRRIILTGTPLQNNLVEYHCMVQFVKPNLLGTKNEFKNRFVNPIQNGQFEDSTAHDVRVMKRRAHVLHSMLDGLVQRKDYNVLTPYLPPKYEYVIHLKLSDVQVKLYRHYLFNIVQQNQNPDADTPVPKGKRLFADFQNLMWICLHPRCLMMKSVKDEKKAEKDELEEDSEGSLRDFIADNSDSSDFKTSDSESSDNEGSSKDGSVASEKKPRKGRKTRAQGSASEPEEEPPPVPSKKWWSDIINESDMVDIRTSSKLFLFFNILKFCEEIGDKLLVFSQSLYTLDIIEYFLDTVDNETQKPEEERLPGIKGFEGSWAKGLDYFRLDGSSACDNRESWCKSFNRPDNTRARLFLISTRAGGLGINLTGANRVIIFDASWNPSFDVQSLFRVYRFGQSKPCYIYRFLSKGTMEEKVYERQVAKLSTSLRVIDEHQIDRHFSHSALAELYTFDPEGSELQGTPILPKDRLMAELIQSHKDIIISYHQHDSLLENQEDQELTEEERKAAWTEFDNEKNQKPMPFNQMNLNPGSLLSMLVDIKTKLAWQNPTLTEEQLIQTTMEMMKKFSNYTMIAPYTGVLTNQLMQLSKSQPANPGGPLMPQFSQMAFPNFRYPLYSNPGSTQTNSASGNSLLNPPGPSAQTFNNHAAANSFLMSNSGINQANLATNPKAVSALNHTFAMNPKHALAQNAAQKAANTGSTNDPIEID